MAQPSQTDFTPPFDPTGYVTISGAQLLQYLSGLTPFTDKGLALVTTDIAGVPQVPDANTVTKWKTYFWVRQSVSLVSLYLWNQSASSDPTYLQWQSINVIGIGAGSIVDAMIADNTITDAKIANLSYSKLIGAPSGLTPSGDAGGDLTGTYPNPTIAARAVTGGKTAIATITGGDGATTGNLALKTVDVRNMLGDGVAKDMQRVTVADTTKMEWFVPSSLVDSAAGVVTTANALKIPQVATAGAGDTGTWSMKTVVELLGQNRFTSAQVNLSIGAQLINAAHGLGAVPSVIRPVLVNISTELGYSVGDEINALSGTTQTSNGNIETANVSFTVGCSATNVFVVQINAAAGGTGAISILHKTTGVATAITQAKWQIKIYVGL